MTVRNQDITFGRLGGYDKMPYERLLLADPSKVLIDEYLKQSDVFVARQNEEILGVVVLFPLTAEAVEIKSISVKPEFQGQGIGGYLMENVVRAALLNNN